MRMTNLTGQLIRTRTRATIINVSNKLSSALTLLIAIVAFSTLGVPQKRVVNVAVPNFNAASHACAGTYSLVHSLNIALGRVPVGRTYLRRFHSVSRSPSIRSIACRGDRTHRQARLLVSITGRGGNLIVKANSLSRLTLN